MRLLILVASMAFASCGVLRSDVTGDLRPPLPAQQDTSGYVTTAGLGALADAGAAGAENGKWVGVQDQQQLHQYQQQQQEVAVSLSGQDQRGLLASYQSSTPQVPQIPQYRSSVLGGQGAEYQSSGVSLTTGAGAQQVQPLGTGYKYTSVAFGNGLLGLGHTVDYNAIGQTQNDNNQNYLASHANVIAGSASGVSLPSAQYGAYDTISVSEHVQTVPIELPGAYQVTHSRPVHAPVTIPTPADVPRPVSVGVSQPVPVHVERPYPAYAKVPVSVKVPHKVELPEYHQHLDFSNDDHHHHRPHGFHYHRHQQLPHVSFNAHGFHKDYNRYKPVTNQHAHHEHYDVPHHRGSNHHSSSILAGLTGGLSSKLRGGHGGGAHRYPGGGHGATASFGGDHKFANELDEHSYHADAGHQLGHGFSGSLGFISNLGYASGYSGKYIADYTKPSFASSSPSFSTGKYSELVDFAGYHDYKVPETINQQYDANGGYKY